jgi:hypothetical protein
MRVFKVSEIKEYSEVLKRGVALSKFNLELVIQPPKDNGDDPSVPRMQVQIYRKDQRRVRAEIILSPKNKIRAVSVVDPDRLIVSTANPQRFIDAFGENAMQYGRQIIVLKLTAIHELTELATSYDPVGGLKKELAKSGIKFKLIEKDGFAISAQGSSIGSAAQVKQATGKGRKIEPKWNIKRIMGAEAQQFLDDHLRPGSQTVTVAVIDGPVLRTHVELMRGNLLQAIRVEPGPPEPNMFSHGTNCTGVIFGAGKVGVLGVAPNCNLLPIDFSGPDSFNYGKRMSNSDSRLLEALQQAVENGARIVSLSWELVGHNFAIGNLINEYSEQCLVVVSAGNQGTNLASKDLYPASYKAANMISVIETDKDNEYHGSNYGVTTAAHIGAPGSCVWCCDGDGDFDFGNESGSSISAPHVAGVAALVWQANPGASVAEVKDCVLNSAKPIAGLASRCLTGGIVNALRAVRMALGFPPDVFP